MWNIDNLVEILEILATIKHLHLLGPVIHLYPGTPKSDEARMEILQKGLEIINEKFPLESQFCLIDLTSQHEIKKYKWEKAVLNDGIIQNHLMVFDEFCYDEETSVQLGLPKDYNRDVTIDTVKSPEEARREKHPRSNPDHSLKDKNNSSSSTLTSNASQFPETSMLVEPSGGTKRGYSFSHSGPIPTDKKTNQGRY